MWCLCVCVVAMMDNDDDDAVDDVVGACARGTVECGSRCMCVCARARAGKRTRNIHTPNVSMLLYRSFTPFTRLGRLRFTSS